MGESEPAPAPEPENNGNNIKGILKKSTIPPKRRSAPHTTKLSVNTTTTDDDEYEIDVNDLEETSSDGSNDMKIIDKAISNLDKAIQANQDANPKKKKKFKMLFSKIRGNRKSWSP